MNYTTTGEWKYPIVPLHRIGHLRVSSGLRVTDSRTLTCPHRCNSGNTRRSLVQRKGLLGGPRLSEHLFVSGQRGVLETAFFPMISNDSHDGQVSPRRDDFIRKGTQDVKFAWMARAHVHLAIKCIKPLQYFGIDPSSDDFTRRQNTKMC